MEKSSKKRFLYPDSLEKWNQQIEVLKAFSNINLLPLDTLIHDEAKKLGKRFKEEHRASHVDSGNYCRKYVLYLN